MEKEKLVSMVKLVQSGDEQAFTQMYNAFHNDLYYYIYKTVNDQELAADLTQDAFIEILQNIHSLQEPAAFITWSRQIAYRRCTAYFKKRHEYLAEEDEDGYSVFDTIAEDRAEFIPDEALDKEDLRKTIQNMINDLPEEQRAALMMRYFDEISVADIARIQGVSEGTVKSRLNYGRKAIKQSVEDYEKKNNIKLRCVGIVPLLLWLLREYRLANGLSLTTGQASATGAAAAISAAGTATAATATAAAATGAAATAATAAVTGGLIAKVVAGVVAAAVAIGGVAVGVHQLTGDTETKPSKKDNVTVQLPGAVNRPGGSTNNDSDTKPGGGTTEDCLNTHNIRYVCEWLTPIGEVDGMPAYLVRYDYFCADCNEMGVISHDDLVRDEHCRHSWEQTQIRHPDMDYTRGLCQICGIYDILEFTLHSCLHDWIYAGRESICRICDIRCDHTFGKRYDEAWVKHCCGCDYDGGIQHTPTGRYSDEANGIFMIGDPNRVEVYSGMVEAVSRRYYRNQDGNYYHAGGALFTPAATPVKIFTGSQSISSLDYWDADGNFYMGESTVAFPVPADGTLVGYRPHKVGQYSLEGYEFYFLRDGQLYLSMFDTEGNPVESMQDRPLTFRCNWTHVASHTITEVWYFNENYHPLFSVNTQSIVVKTDDGDLHYLPLGYVEDDQGNLTTCQATEMGTADRVYDVTRAEDWQAVIYSKGSDSAHLYFGDRNAEETNIRVALPAGYTTADVKLAQVTWLDADEADKNTAMLLVEFVDGSVYYLRRDAVEAAGEEEIILQLICHEKLTQLGKEGHIRNIANISCHNDWVVLMDDGYLYDVEIG